MINLLVKVFTFVQIYTFLKHITDSNNADVLHKQKQSDNRVHPEDKPARSNVLDDAQS